MASLLKPGNIAVVFSILSFVTLCASHGGFQRAAPIFPTAGAPWPAPQKMTPSLVVYELVPDTFRFSVDGRCDTIQNAFTRYKKLIFGSTPTMSSLKYEPLVQREHVRLTLNELSVTVKSKCLEDSTFPSLKSDESYKLTISNGLATLTANEMWGALRGLETFSQLVYLSNGKFTINDTDIEDYPRFNHRGILLDTSRHFLSVDVIKTNLDIMAQNKFNVFHWHIVDDQAFPYVSKAFPEMSEFGSYNPHTHVYNPSDVKMILEYARERGIRVVPEFDTPGHTQSWGLGIPDLLTKCYSGGKPTGSFGPINPALNTTFPFLKKFFLEISEVFKDHYIHLGGDEVSFDCWKSNMMITDFMKKMQFGTDYSKLEQFYMQGVINIVNSLKKGYLIWQEVIDNNATVAEDTVVNVWKGHYQTEMSKVTKMGYKALLSSCWYINYIGYGPKWEGYYTCDPQDFNGTEAQKELVMGGEACIWGEYVDDTNLIPRLWPSASAVAERLWSDSSVNSPDKAAARIEEHRCRLVRRGYPVEPANGPSFCDKEYVYMD